MVNVAVAPDGVPAGVMVGAEMLVPLVPGIDHVIDTTSVVLASANEAVAP
jgi:hypothetical protein